MLRRFLSPCGTTGEFRGKLVRRPPNVSRFGVEGYVSCWILTMQIWKGHLTMSFLRSGESCFAERGGVLGLVSSVSSFA